MLTNTLTYPVDSTPSPMLEESTNHPFSDKDSNKHLAERLGELEGLLQITGEIHENLELATFTLRRIPIYCGGKEFKVENLCHRGEVILGYSREDLSRWDFIVSRFDHADQGVINGNFPPSKSEHSCGTYRFHSKGQWRWVKLFLKRSGDVITGAMYFDPLGEKYGMGNLASARSAASVA